jgi:hypothetical protein
MYADVRLSAAMDSMIRGIDAPPVPMTAIRNRMDAPPVSTIRRGIPFARYALTAAAAIAIFAGIFPRASLGLVERFQHIVVASYAAAYKVMGWAPPPAPPRSLEASLASRRLSLAAAQSKEPFTIVVPSGIPADATLSSIHTMPALVYDKTAHRWSKGTPAIDFRYKRSGRRQFELMAEEDDPRLGPTHRYIYEARDLPGGKVELIKHERFQWRNGRQLMTAIEDDGIGAAEIQTIRRAMHGEPLAHFSRATIEKQFVLAPP